MISLAKITACHFAKTGLFVLSPGKHSPGFQQEVTAFRVRKKSIFKMDEVKMDPVKKATGDAAPGEENQMGAMGTQGHEGNEENVVAPRLNPWKSKKSRKSSKSSNSIGTPYFLTSFVMDLHH